MARATQVRHAGIVVADLDRALWFYGDLLGLNVQRRTVETGLVIANILAVPDVEVETVKMGTGIGTAQIELLSFISHPVSQTTGDRVLKTGPTHVAFTVDDLGSLYERMSAFGVEFNCTPQLSPDGQVLVTYCKDPEGNLVELVEIR